MAVKFVPRARVDSATKEELLRLTMGDEASSITTSLEDSPTNGIVTKAPTSNWAYDHNTDVTTKHLPSQTGASGKYLKSDGSVASWDTPAAGSSLRTAPYILSSNTGTANEKAGDDDTCDDANDEVQLAAADNSAAKGKVSLSTGTFILGAALTLDAGSTLVGQGSGILDPATKLSITGTNYGILLTPVGSRLGGIADLTIYTPQNFATAALTIQNNSTDIRGYKVLSGVMLHAYGSGVGETGETDVTAGSSGIKFICTGGFNQCIYNDVAVFGYEKTMWVYINETADTYYYMNGNFFNNWTLSSGKYLTYFETKSVTGWNQGDFAGNQFNGLILEPWWETSTTTQYGLYTVDDNGAGGYGRFYANQIVNCHIWDNGDIVNEALLLAANSYGNRITACFTFGRDSDLGTDNTIIRVPP
jgi:hypothetical protein